MSPHPRLVDAQEVGRSNPGTFQLPPAHRLNLLGEGALAKVCLQDEECGERFWVKVTGPPVGGVYPGEVANLLVVVSDPPLVGETIHFEARHVYDTRFPGED